MNKSHLWIFWGPTLFLIACTHPVRTQIPTTLFTSSETHGLIQNKKFTTHLGMKSDDAVTIIPDVTTTPILTQDVKIKSGHDLFLGADFHNSDRFDIGGNFVTGSVPWRIDAKFLIFGKPATQSDKGTFSCSVAAEFGFSGTQDWSSEERENSIFGSPVRTFKADVEEAKYSGIVGLLFGYRVDRKLLIYTGINSIGGQDDGKVKPKINDVAQSEIPVTFIANGYSVPLGIELGREEARVHAELNYSNITASHSARWSQYNFAFGFWF